MGREAIQKVIWLFGARQCAAVGRDELELDAEVRRKARKDRAVINVIGENPLEQIDWPIEHGLEELIELQKRIEQEIPRPVVMDRGKQLAAIQKPIVKDQAAAENVCTAPWNIKPEPFFAYEYAISREVIQYWVRS